MRPLLLAPTLWLPLVLACTRGLAEFLALQSWRWRERGMKR